MIHAIFAASDKFNLDYFADFDKFLDNCFDSQDVVLENEAQLELFLNLIGIPKLKWIELIGMNFFKYCDISEYSLPVLDNDQFEEFYKNWLNQSKRENNMDEYGNIIFLQGLTSNWNNRKYRLIMIEK